MLHGVRSQHLIFNTPIHTMEPEKKRVSGRVRVEPTRPEPDPKTRLLSGNPT
jgi:hypothetical protein